MPVNLGLAQLSNNFLICTVVLYSLALLAYAGDFAFGRHPSTAVIPAAEEPELVAAGVSAAGGAAAPDRARPRLAAGPGPPRSVCRRPGGRRAAAPGGAPPPAPPG